MIYEMKYWDFPIDLLPFIAILIILLVRRSEKATNSDGFDSKLVTWGVGSVVIFFTLSMLLRAITYFEYYYGDRSKFDVMEGEIQSIETNGRYLYITINGELLVYGFNDSCRLNQQPKITKGSVIRFLYEDAEGYNTDCVVQIKVIEESGNTEPYKKVDTKH